MFAKIKAKLMNQKLSRKLIIISFVALVLPTFIISIIASYMIRAGYLQNEQKKAEVNMAIAKARVDKNIEMMMMTAKNVSSYYDNIDFATSYTDDTSVLDLIEFKYQAIKMQNAIESNPYIYQMRIFLGNDTMPEIYPIFFHASRIVHSEWYQTIEDKPIWRIGHTNDFAVTQMPQPERKLVSYITSIYDSKGKAAGYIEVSMFLDVFLLGVDWDESAPKIMLLTREDAAYYCEQDTLFFSGINTAQITGEGQGAIWDIQSQPYIVQQEYVNSSAWVLLSFTPIGDVQQQTDRVLVMFMLALIMLCVFLLWAVRKLILNNFARLYGVIDAIEEVGQGNLDVQIVQQGNDEVASIAKHMLHVVEKIKSLIQKNHRQEMAAQTTELHALQSQINAHFIYNVLETISMMAELNDNYEVCEAVTNLGSLLRYSMKWERDVVTLFDEIEYIGNYISLINYRYDRQTHLHQNIPRVFYGLSIPKMTLQPIIENVIHHGADSLDKDTDITIYCYEKNKTAYIEILDNGKGIPTEQLRALNKNIKGNKETVSVTAGNGIALANVNSRIVLYFGDEYGVTVESEENVYTKVIVKLPYN